MKSNSFVEISAIKLSEKKSSEEMFDRQETSKLSEKSQEADRGLDVGQTNTNMNMLNQL